MPMMLLLTASKPCHFYDVMKRKSSSSGFTLEFTPGFTVSFSVNAQRRGGMSLLKRLLGQGGVNGGHQRAGHGGGHHGNRYNQHGEPGPQCPECRAVNKSGARYCHRCGQPFAAVSATCGQCAAPLPSGSHFCPQCGGGVP
jgi:hypothetical protein